MRGHAAQLSCTPPALQVARMLAGLVRPAEAAAGMGLAETELQDIVRGLGLDGAAFVPVDIDRDGNIAFADVGRESFDAPTFDEAVEQAVIRKGTRRGFRFWLPASALCLDVSASLPPPTAIMFHVGRCGSTLLCNLVALSQDWLAAREPEVINRLLARHGSTGEPAPRDTILTVADRLLRCLAAGLQRREGASRRQCMIKLSSWNVLFAPALAARLADTRFLMIVRDPLETVASCLENPPNWSPPPSPDSGASRRKDTRHYAQAWSAMVGAALALPAERTRFVAFDALISRPRETLETVLAHCGEAGCVALPGDIASTMAQYSKARGEAFDAQGRHKRRLLEPHLQDMVSDITRRAQHRLQHRLQVQG